MAKRAAKGEFVMAAEIRALLESNKNLTGPEVVAALQKKFPSQEINRNSASVAFANARKSMGITSAKRVKKRRRPVRRNVLRSTPTATTSSPVNLEVLQAAKSLLQKCGGDASAASNALKSVAALQVN